MLRDTVTLSIARHQFAIRCDRRLVYPISGRDRANVLVCIHINHCDMFGHMLNSVVFGCPGCVDKMSQQSQHLPLVARGRVQQGRQIGANGDRRGTHLMPGEGGVSVGGE